MHQFKYELKNHQSCCNELDRTLILKSFKVIKRSIQVDKSRLIHLDHKLHLNLYAIPFLDPFTVLTTINGFLPLSPLSSTIKGPLHSSFEDNSTSSQHNKLSPPSSTIKANTISSTHTHTYLQLSFNLSLNATLSLSRLLLPLLRNTKSPPLDPEEPPLLPPRGQYQSQLPLSSYSSSFFLFLLYNIIL